MKRLIALLFLYECYAFDLPRTNCNSDLKIGHDHYNNTDTYDVGDAYPTDAHYDDQGNLFYVESGHNEQGFYYNAKVIPERGSESRSIEGLPQGISYSIAFDKKDTTVYFGTGRGIYKYDYDSETAYLISESNLTLNMIFVDKDGNKYITESNNGIEELYLLDGRKKIRFHALEALNEMGIDGKNNFYYIKEEKLFVLKATSAHPVCIGNVTYDGMAQISFHREKVFVASDKLQYAHENDTQDLKEIVNVPGKVTAVAFDVTGDFVLGVRGKLLKYKKSDCYIRSDTVKKTK